MVASSLVPTAGGFVSIGNRHSGVGKGRRAAGACEAPCREAYAAALRDQIEAQGKAAQQVTDGAEMLFPYGNMVASVVVDSTAEQKAGYGVALREQMAADERRKVERRAAEDSLDRALRQEQHVTPRRLLRPVAPRPATESYAAQLGQQIAEQQVQRRANADAFKTPAPTGVDGMPGADPPVVGRRRTITKAPQKSDYASELRGQMAERELRNLREQSTRTPEEERAPFAFVRTVAPRGKRTDVERPSPDSYMHALQEQMAERAADREAKAHHRQATPGRRDAASPSRRSPKSGRAPPSKAEYAAMLGEQIADRNLHRARVGGAGGGLTSQAGGGAVVPMGGDEHVFRPRPIESVEPAAYQEQLREQISGRRAQLAAQAFHAQRPEEAAVLPFLPQAAPSERVQGKRVVGALAARDEIGTADEYAADLRQQIAQREGVVTEWKRIDDARVARQIDQAHRQAADRQGAIDRARQFARPPEARDALDHFVGGVLPG